MKELKEEIERRHRLKRNSKNSSWIKLLFRIIILIGVLFFMNNLNKRYHKQTSQSFQKIKKTEN